MIAFTPERCFFDLFHVKTATLILGILFVIGGLCGLLQCFRKQTFSEVILSFIWNVFTWAAGSTAIYAIDTRDPRFLWPMIICHYVTIAFTCFFIFVFLIATCFPDTAAKIGDMAGFDGNAHVSTMRCATISISVMLVVVFVLEFWSLRIVTNCQVWMVQVSRATSASAVKSA
ncbi:hypothetical protein L596_022213 [Steinernema carpocapsae]|uniref:MARVEL domain-containing protein n=1 Tax=Steinernema carpocapsae TaxID=34508 RepID=A0A4V6A051_STECR|nr:hypothetical protein L596_022213 [Steinernema carpocapsae]